MLRLFNIIVSFVVAVFPIFSQSNGIITIDLVNPHIESIPMSRFFKNVKYTPLETNELCSLNKKYKYYLTNQYIIGLSVFENAYLFDRETGTLIKQIGKEGDGENEYRWYPIEQYGLDEKNNILFFDDKDQWKGFSITDKKIIKVAKPQEWIPTSIVNPYPFGNNNFIGYVSNTTGDINVKLAIFDIKGKVLHTFPNYQTYLKKSTPAYYTTFSGKFYNYNNQVYFKENYNDTVFIVRSNALVPHIIFNLSDNTMPYDAIENFSKYTHCYNIQLVKETNAYIFFNYSTGASSNRILINGYYDKKNKQTYVCKTIDGKAGFINDIDEFPAFNLQLITNNNQFLDVIFPEDLLNYYNSTDKNKFNSRGKTIISRIKATDNPIIVTANLE